MLCMNPVGSVFMLEVGDQENIDRDQDDDE